MHIECLNQQQLTQAYGILCRPLFSRSNTTNLGMTYCRIEPQGSTQPHEHIDAEHFVIMHGTGTMQIEGESVQVSAGDIINIPAFSTHVLHNLSAIEPLDFISVATITQPLAPLADKALIIPAPPTPNGDLHIGHLAGPYLAADVLARYLKLRSTQVRLVTGTDDHQTFVSTKANQLKNDEATTIQQFRQSIATTFRLANIELDEFYHPANNQHYQHFVTTVFNQLIQSGKLQLRDSTAAYCSQCNNSIIEADIAGHCPNCAAPQVGHGCEHCGHISDIQTLLKPHCKQCAQSIELVPMQRYYFAIEAFKPELASLQQSALFQPHMQAYCQQLQHNMLPDFAVTSPGSWGIAAPNLAGQVIHVWFEMAAAYLYAMQNASTAWNTNDFAMLILNGFDNGFYYTTLVPALMLAYDSTITLPSAFINNEFYLLNAEKFSTSRQHAIWANDYLQTMPTDIVRLYLMYDRPETTQSNFTEEKIKRFIENQIKHTLDKVIVTLDHLAATHLQYTIPTTSIKQFTPDQQQYIFTINTTINQIESNYHPQQFSPRGVTRTIFNALSQLIDFIEAQMLRDIAHTDTQQLNNAIIIGLSALQHLSLALIPITPKFASQLYYQLTCEKNAVWLKEFTLLTSGKKIQSLANSQLHQATVNAAIKEPQHATL